MKRQFSIISKVIRLSLREKVAKTTVLCVLLCIILPFSLNNEVIFLV